ncbi:MAG: penicillin epimerase [Acidobacteria bacterium RIFCSPLOWO2_02_FULL_67_36]|nr:MAG: penicillin epimerase [Acidobacteria bacterium RIFCSPLOWO2_02_FULL_67_36]OFW22893.1 MAG: penicillin epimerase [Acidobacteria bacterium RIFCSPLOWO2_12_FULL_66_21]
MRTSRRIFLRTAAAGAAVPFLGPRVLDALERRIEPFGGLSTSQAVGQDALWAEIRRVFPVPAEYINLENGYSSPQPAPTFEALQKYQATINGGLSFYMRRKWADDRIAVKKALAELAGVPPEEIVITRNTTESLGTVIHGLTYAPGDEAVMCDQDYGSMLQQFRQEARRHGVKCVEISIPLAPRDDQEMVDTYAKAITPRTKVILLSHMVNITGHILPVRKIADMAHARGVAVIVDAAHSFAHVNFTIPQLDGDYFGASLHKWLCTPLGAGILHLKKARIPTLWPLLGDTSVEDGDIRKLERTGTQPSWTPLAIADAIRFHNMIGPRRKEARLRYLQQYWTDKVRGLPKVYLNTPTGDRACAIANVGVTGMKPKDLADALFDKFKIYTVAIDTVAVKGVRVTPHLYTTTAELDALVKAMTEIARGA